MQLKKLLHPTWAVRVAGSAFFAALTAGAAAVVELLGSVYPAEIANAFPLAPVGPWSGWSGRAVAFWIALLSLAWLVYLRQVADDGVRGRLMETTESAEQTTRRIEEFAQTLPPAGFQAQLTRFVVPRLDDSRSAAQVRCRGRRAHPNDPWALARTRDCSRSPTTTVH